MRRDPRVYCIGEDIVLGVPFGVTKGLVEEFGADRVLNAPISEAAIVGSAMGAAMTGLVPVVDMHFADFVTCAMDEVANQIAKSRYMFGGQFDCPLVLRMPYGIGRSGGGHHSNSVEAWFVNIPGLKICIPSTPGRRARSPQDRGARPRSRAALRAPGLYRVTGEVPEAETLVPLGLADVKRPGRDVTVIATARMVGESLEAARRLAEEDIEVEVIDPRSLVPLDRDTLAASVRRTNHVVIAEEGPMRGSTGAWLAWVIMEECFDDLDAPIAPGGRAEHPDPVQPAAGGVRDTQGRRRGRRRPPGAEVAPESEEAPMRRLACRVLALAVTLALVAVAPLACPGAAQARRRAQGGDDRRAADARPAHHHRGHRAAHHLAHLRDALHVRPELQPDPAAGREPHGHRQGAHLHLQAPPRREVSQRQGDDLGRRGGFAQPLGPTGHARQAILEERRGARGQGSVHRRDVPQGHLRRAADGPGAAEQRRGHLSQGDRGRGRRQSR